MLIIIVLNLLTNVNIWIHNKVSPNNHIIKKEQMLFFYSHISSKPQLKKWIRYHQHIYYTIFY